jgi:hypothetical protein
MWLLGKLTTSQIVDDQTLRAYSKHSLVFRVIVSGEIGDSKKQRKIKIRKTTKIGIRKTKRIELGTIKKNRDEKNKE